MPNIPVRDLGGVGIISDIHPYDLPPNVFSAGVNVRFENGKVTRGPVFRRVHQFEEDFLPAYLFSIPPIASGIESLIAVSHDYSSILSITGDSVEDVTPMVINAGDTQQNFSHTFLGSVAYLNRKSNVPLQKAPSDAQFMPLTAWDPSWRCGVLRSYKDFLIALNVTKGAVEYPSMVKWSDVAMFGQAPASWDATATTTSAGENILNEMKGPIIEGRTLRDSFYIYGETETWAMTFTGGPFLFDFRKRFDDVGIINANCVVEVDGQHYVFDRNDIFVHDGANKQSIIHGMNKDFVFRSIIRDLKHLCFVSHDPKLNEIHFCYPSQDRLVAYQGISTGCNRAAVFNYRRKTWTFYDIPNVTAATVAQVATGQTYASVGTVSYQQMGGTYIGDGDGGELHSLFAGRLDPGNGLSKSRIMGLDLLSGGRLAKPIETEALKDAFVERVGIDLDESGAALTSYKSLLKIYPQLGVSNGESQVRFQFGANDLVGNEPAWDEPQHFDPSRDYQLSVRRAGRYLAYRLFHSGITDFSFSGFDALLTVRGKR